MKKNTYINVIARFFATAGGAGYSPVAPGTCGTAVSVPLAWLTSGLALWQFLAVTVAIIVVGIWSANISDDYWGTHDSGKIVIDEVAGYFVTVAVIDRADWVLLAMGFVIFRFFDIVKPPPVRWLDKNLPGGTGVVMDDVAAGIMGCVVLYAIAQTRVPADLLALLSG